MKDSIKEILTGNHLNKMFKMYLVARKILKVKAYIKGILTSKIFPSYMKQENFSRILVFELSQTDFSFKRYS